MSLERWLAPLFLGDLDPAVRARFDTAPAVDIEPLLATAVETGARTWPAVEVDAARYVRHLATIVDETDEPASLASLQHGDLYLACACIDGDPTAVATLERDYISTLAAPLRSTGLDPHAAEDVIQRVREIVLVGSDGVPGIANYRGKGQLRSWLRAVAIRQGMMEFRGRKETPTGSDALEDMPAVAHDPELAPWKAKYAAAFRSAFAATVASLDERERTLLKQHHLDRLSIDALAALHGVHRATAARWVATARENLLAGIRRRLIDELAISGTALDSALRLARSQLDVSIHRLIDDKRPRKKRQ